MNLHHTTHKFESSIGLEAKMDTRISGNCDLWMEGLLIEWSETRTGNWQSWGLNEQRMCVLGWSSYSMTWPMTCQKLKLVSFLTIHYHTVEFRFNWEAKSGSKKALNVKREVGTGEHGEDRGHHGTPGLISRKQKREKERWGAWWGG